jgi:hypothetical protein
LVIGAIALLLCILMVIGINAGLIRFDWAAPNTVFGVM